MSRTLSTREAAEHLGVSIRTLQAWRRTGEGPEFLRVSANRCRYEAASLEKWCGARRRASNTSDAASA